MESNMNITTSKPPAEHVTKASSDELLKKFAQVVSEADLKKDRQLAIKKRRKISNSSVAAAADRCDSPSGRRASWPERRSLLPMGKRRIMGRSRVRDLKNKSIFGTIQKTWRRTVEGASKVFVEKHFYNRHKRLINDPVY